MSNSRYIEKLENEKKMLLFSDEEKIKKQHDSGKMTALERVEALLDKASFVELYSLLSNDGVASGVVCGYGTIATRPVYIFSQDYTVNSGAISKLQAKKICKLLKTALQNGAPVIALLDSAGVNLKEGVLAMDAYADIFAGLSELSGICPVISVVAGMCMGGSSVIAQMSDICIGVEKIAHTCMYGPSVLNAAYGKNLKLEDFAGTKNISAQGGYSLVVDSEEQAFAFVQKILSYLPDCNSDSSFVEDCDCLNKLFNDVDVNDAYQILTEISDENDFVVLNQEYAPSVLTALSRIGGIPSALIINNWNANDGLMSASAMNKAARFVQFADCFNLPIVSICNSKGLAIPEADKQVEIIKAQAKLISAYANASVAKISLVVGNAIGQSYTAMVSRANNDMVFAWPEAIISALQPDAAIQVIWQDKIKASNLPVENAKEAIVEEYINEHASALAAAKAGLVDEIIESKYSRMHIISALEMLRSKSVSTFSKKHGNAPL